MIQSERDDMEETRNDPTLRLCASRWGGYDRFSGGFRDVDLQQHIGHSAENAEGAEFLSVDDHDDQLGVLVIVPKRFELPGAQLGGDTDHRVHQRPSAGFLGKYKGLFFEIGKIDAPIQLFAVEFEGEKFAHGALGLIHVAIMQEFWSRHDVFTVQGRSIRNTPGFRHHVGDIEQAFQNPGVLVALELEFNGIDLMGRCPRDGCEADQRANRREDEFHEGISESWMEKRCDGMNQSEWKFSIIIDAVPTKFSEGAEDALHEFAFLLALGVLDRG